MNRLNVAIIGTRGIPNHYGGFEKAAEQISVGLVKKGHDVTVYNSHRHPFKGDNYQGVHIIHCFDPEFKLGTAGQFIYDLNCIRDASRNNFDIILFLGYTSSSVWWRLFPKKAIITSNMDGLEWKRTKYNAVVQKFLKHAESLAVKHSHFLIADSIGIQQHIQQRYDRECELIAYGADLNLEEIPSTLQDWRLEPQQYFMLTARMEPENNIEMILDGFVSSQSKKGFIVVGNHTNAYGRKLIKKYHDKTNIRFAGAIYEQDKIHTLRKHGALYFHGHSVGGTNPSLLEAMASKAAIAAHDNIFNRAILGEDAFYFSTSNDVAEIISCHQTGSFQEMKENNYSKIKEQFNWPAIIDQYEQFLLNCLQKHKHEEPIRDKRHAIK